MPKQGEGALIHAARRGGGLHKWVNDHTGSGADEVLTDATLYYDIPVGKQVLITGIGYDMETVSDDCHFGMVKCSAVAGGGDAVEISGHTHIFTGASIDGSSSGERYFNPPILVKYSDTAKSITIKIHTSDSSAIVSCGWCGIVEEIT